WDYSTVTPGFEYPESLLISDEENGFTGTQGMRYYNSPFAVGELIDSRAYFTQDANGYYYNGFTTAEEAYDLQFVTGNADDSIYFPLSTNNYGLNSPVYLFP